MAWWSFVEVRFRFSLTSAKDNSPRLSEFDPSFSGKCLNIVHCLFVVEKGQVQCSLNFYGSQLSAKKDIIPPQVSSHIHTNIKVPFL